MNANVEQFKALMSNYPTGVTIVTTMAPDGKPVGLTVNSFASVSLEPLMVLWCIGRHASSYELFQQAPRFAVHLLAAEQKELCMRFAQKGVDRFAGIAWRVSENGLPILPDVMGVLECDCVQQVEAGDHLILVGKVIALQNFDKEPLAYFRRQVGSLKEIGELQ